VGHSDEQPVFEQAGNRVEPRGQRGRILDAAEPCIEDAIAQLGTPSRCVTRAPIASRRPRTSGSASSITSAGTGNVSPRFRTSFVSSTRTTKRAADAATIFSFVCAPPPPFMRSSAGVTSSAPSTARSRLGASASVRTVRPPARGDARGPARGHHARELERLLAGAPGEPLDEPSARCRRCRAPRPCRPRPAPRRAARRGRGRPRSRDCGSRRASFRVLLPGLARGDAHGQPVLLGGIGQL
jgi:hypothetical protein